MRPAWLSLVFIFALLHGSSVAGELSAKDQEQAHKLYVNKCAKCHKFYDPARYSDAQWQGWLDKMSKKSKLNANQQKILAEYLAETYRSQRRGAQSSK